MGNCANKPLTTEGDAPVEEVAETKATTTTTTTEREIEVDQNKVSSLAQMLENDGKKPEAEGATKAVDEKASEPTKIEQVASKEVAAVETKKEEASKPADEPKKEEAKPAASEPKKEEAKPVVAPAPATATATAPVPAATTAPAPAAATAEKK